MADSYIDLTDEGDTKPRSPAAFKSWKARYLKSARGSKNGSVILTGNGSKSPNRIPGTVKAK